MKHTFLILLSIVALFGSDKNPVDSNRNIITSDITNFWEAYDKIITTQDSVLQFKYLDSLYFKRGTLGLEGIRQARNYTPQDYIQSITNYPKFWSSIRQNTLQAENAGFELEHGIAKLKTLYPDLKPATIYFSIGALRTPGTTIDSLVLIGAELAMTDTNTDTSEFPANLSHLDPYFKTNPKEHLVFLNLHEYVHTQQKAQVFNILSLTIYEGVAEFVAEKALGTPSPNPQIAFGKAHADRIRTVFENDMFYHNNLGKWLNGNTPNEFEMRDLGYYVGYQLCENYYKQSKEKTEAIKTMIELDYTNEAEVEAFLQKANYFSKPLDAIYKDFESKRPTVIKIKQFKNKQQNVSPKITEITIEFSQALNGTNTGVDFGELGQEAFPKGTLTGRHWGDGNTSWTMPVSLEPNTVYQLFITNNFRTDQSIPLQPYVIEFKTAK